MLTMRLMKNLSEDAAFPSVFLVLDAKGGEEDLSILAILFSYSSGCNMRLSTMLDISYSS
jgi:hypothetical protein